MKKLAFAALLALGGCTAAVVPAPINLLPPPTAVVVPAPGVVVGAPVVVVRPHPVFRIR